MHGAHPQRVRFGEVAGVILEHGSAVGGETVARDDRVKRRALRLGKEACVFDTVYSIEKSREPAGGDPEPADDPDAERDPAAAEDGDGQPDAADGDRGDGPTEEQAPSGGQTSVGTTLEGAAPEEPGVG